ncbi:MAG: GNAT family N-acetyltransferase [Clostridia bacterium]|nr:GNAT family N-acetyltransferase [Clostridia bacterium]
MIISVRSAIAEDTDAVYGLLRTIADIHREARPDMFPDLVSKYTPDEVRERLSRSENGVFVAESDGSVIGYVFCDVIKEGRGNTLYIDDLCVDGSMRRSGVASALMNRAEAYANENNCKALMLNVWEFNESAIAFYEKYGFLTRTRHMEKFL